MKETISKQIETARDILSVKWYDELQTIVMIGVKRKYVPDASKPRSLKRFFNCIAAQMTQNLQDIVIHSLHKFTDFICGVNIFLLKV